MSLAAGKLRHRLALQSRTLAQDAVTGEMVPTWATAAEVFGAIEPLSVREFIQSGAGQVQLTARITLRARSDINNTWRILHLSTGKIYNVEGVLPDKESGLEYITVPVTTGAALETQPEVENEFALLSEVDGVAGPPLLAEVDGVAGDAILNEDAP